MILNEGKMDISLRNTWLAIAEKLDALGYNLSVSSGRKGATVYEKQSENLIGSVTREMIEEEEIDYILYSHLNLKRKTGEA